MLLWQQSSHKLRSRDNRDTGEREQQQLELCISSLFTAQQRTKWWNVASSKVNSVLTVSHPSQICSILCLYKKTSMSTMLHTVTEMFWMKSDACATKSRQKQSTSKKSKAAVVYISANPLWIPLFLGLRSTQSPIKAPSRSTEPATTSPNTAVSSRLRPYSSIRNTEMAKCHIRSPCETHARCHHCGCFAWRCACALLTPWFNWNVHLSWNLLRWKSFLPTWTKLHWHRWETWDPWGR